MVLATNAFVIAKNSYLKSSHLYTNAALLFSLVKKCELLRYANIGLAFFFVLKVADYVPL